MAQRLLTVQECAARTSTSPAFWRKLVARRRVPIHKVGRLTRIAEEDLDAVVRLGFRPAEPSTTMRQR